MLHGVQCSAILTVAILTMAILTTAILTMYTIGRQVVLVQELTRVKHELSQALAIVSIATVSIALHCTP